MTFVAAALLCLSLGASAEPASLGASDKVSMNEKNDKGSNSLPGTMQEKKQVSGVVKDAAGDPIIGATVLEKITTNGTVTDMDGKFTLNVGKGATLTFSYIGYADQDVAVGSQTSFNITLKEDAELMEEVVVVGYMTQKKGLLTGSVEHMRMSDQMKTVYTTSAGSLLAGKLAGVNVSTPDGVPGSNPSISIRTGSSWKDGRQGVCYVIDGVIRNSTDFNNLSPNEIDDITVLKDAASAAVYGYVRQVESFW